MADGHWAIDDFNDFRVVGVWHAAQRIAVLPRLVKTRESGINAPCAVLFRPAMPLLPKEADLFPDELFALSAGSFPWHVAHVRSRQEKVLARRLLEQRTPFYLPQIERVTDRSSRRFHSFVPLFAGYVFFRGRDHDVVLRSGVTVRIIDVDDQELLGAQLEQIRLLQLAGLRPGAAPGERRSEAEHHGHHDGRSGAQCR